MRLKFIYSGTDIIGHTTYLYPVVGNTWWWDGPDFYWHTRSWAEDVNDIDEQFNKFIDKPVLPKEFLK